MSDTGNVWTDERLDELKKLLKSNKLENLSKDKFSIDLILLIFPELKNIKSIIDAIKVKRELFVDLDIIFTLFLMIIDETDNLEYFLYKYNISKKDQKSQIFFLKTLRLSQM